MDIGGLYVVPVPCAACSGRRCGGTGRTVPESRRRGRDRPCRRPGAAEICQYEAVQRRSDTYRRGRLCLDRGQKRRTAPSGCRELSGGPDRIQNAGISAGIWKSVFSYGRTGKRRPADPYGGCGVACPGCLWMDEGDRQEPGQHISSVGNGSVRSHGSRDRTDKTGVLFRRSACRVRSLPGRTGRQPVRDRRPGFYRGRDRRLCPGRTGGGSPAVRTHSGDVRHGTFDRGRDGREAAGSGRRCTVETHGTDPAGERGGMQN